MLLSRSRFSKFLASVVLAPLAALPLGSAPASADTISTHGTICNRYGSFAESDLLYTESGVWNFAASGTRSVICSIPRGPVPGGGQTFIVEGFSPPEQTTNCAILVFDTRGTSLGAKSFSTTGFQYTRTLTFSAAELPNLAWVSLICTLPRGAYVRGIKALNEATSTLPVLQPR